MDMTTLWAYLFGRRCLRAEAQPGEREEVLTPANVLTLCRAAGSIAILLFAITQGSNQLLLCGLAFSMVLDFLDGQVARGLREETVLGAQLDGAADRITAALVAGGIVSINGGAQLTIASAMVWIQFGVIDLFFSTQFLRFDLWSPDHFHELSRTWGERIWRRNWSALAKLASNLPILLLALQLWWAAASISLLLVIFRVPDYVGVRTLAKERDEAKQKKLEAREPKRLNSRARSGRRDAHLTSSSS
jgi:phosphatidylglycerophosphate synthase